MVNSEMGIDCGLFCDNCKEFVNLGEWLFSKDKFQRNELLFEFLTDHENHIVFFFMDVSNGWLDRLDYKEIMIVGDKQR